MIDPQILGEAAQRLAGMFDPERIILFGSQARGTAGDRSDADLLVVCRVEGPRRRLVLRMDRALRGLRLARDIVVMTPEEFDCERLIPGSVAPPAWIDGKVLYDRAA